MVLYNGSQYLALTNNLGKQPDINPSDWYLFASGGAVGPTGASGKDGKDGADGLSFVYKSEWSSVTTYNLNDVVFYTPTGSSYISLSNGNTNNDPDLTLGVWWDYIAVAGLDGTNGTNGVTGPTGKCRDE
jgi:hypothetical protein